MDLSSALKGDLFDAVTQLAEGQILQMPLSRNLSSIHPGLHEIRLKDRSGQFRFFYFVKRGDAIYLLHAMRKKTQQLQKKEIDLIFKRLREV